ncbi:MAG: CinA family protein [Synergistaceae bacterium]|nr:CinA family protein [Synergistaceae bacterium]
MSRAELLAEETIALFREKGLSLALAESCTGGMIAAALTGIAGASDIFWGSAVTYINDAKENILGVSGGTLKKYGAVSAECAAEMALGARKIYASDIALSVTGIAGPGGGSAEKPVGTVWFGFASERGSSSFLRRFDGCRGEVRRQTVEEALSYLIEQIKGEE